MYSWSAPSRIDHCRWPAAECDGVHHLIPAGKKILIDMNEKHCTAANGKNIPGEQANYAG